MEAFNAYFVKEEISLFLTNGFRQSFTDLVFTARISCYHSEIIRPELKSTDQYQR